MRALITPLEASEIIQASITVAPAITTTIDNAYGHILRSNIIADRNIPPYDRAMMDGIAISSSSGIKTFNVEAIQAAGSAVLRLTGQNKCLEIMTGATIPVGCDCVVPLEELTIKDSIASISDSYHYKKNDFIHNEASEHNSGDVIINPSSLLGAAELAIAASCGYHEIRVSKKPIIYLITTGDEVIPHTSFPESHQIRSSNPIAITEMLQALKLGVVTHKHVSDNKRYMKEAILEALNRADILILTGGVSKGKFDYVAPILTEVAGTAEFHGISQKPGKPFAYYSKPLPIFALPGNPLSVMACMARYVIPSLKAYLKFPIKEETYSLPSQISPNKKITQLMAATVSNGKLKLSLPNNSGDYTALLGCHGVIEIPASTNINLAGNLFNFYSWSDI